MMTEEEEAHQHHHIIDRLRFDSRRIGLVFVIPIPLFPPTNEATGYGIYQFQSTNPPTLNQERRASCRFVYPGLIRSWFPNASPPFFPPVVSCPSVHYINIHTPVGNPKYTSTHLATTDPYMSSSHGGTILYQVQIYARLRT